ncbi:Protein of unknown function [Xylanibacter ruminicola]|uniref:DUF4230 domain-containing protein n=1 Tax=Xylanibacter ruminicola TaxID=839 RepID=A0A1H5RUR6_XYLRU|nr:MULTISPECIES: DUF4230 domain-containing protein [Prevotellaceae]SEF42079.1 Protein of unknown function [Xylanibacter ruminicola]SEW11620.1 Protein of unknown function [Prevotella sp. khp7]
MKTSSYIKIGISIIVVGLLIAVIMWVKSITKGNYVAFGADTAIDVTPTQIQSIKAIGEWEFLSLSAEELVDTVRKGFFTNDELVRIYYGTLRLGVNMHQVEPGWLTTKGDSVIMKLPKIGLLDKDFIDEARTKSFYESGSWKPTDRDALYKKAYRQMLKHCLTKENLQAAEVNADQQLRNMMQSMGYKNIKIVFKN